MSPGLISEIALCARSYVTVEARCDATAFSRVTNGRFKGGYTTRRYGRPDQGVHAIQMELACRGYMDDPPEPVSPRSWPAPYDPVRAAPMREALTSILQACLTFATESAR